MTDQKLQVWWVQGEPPNTNTRRRGVDSPEEAADLLAQWAIEDLADPNIETNAGGLTVFDEELGQLVTWYGHDEDGDEVDIWEWRVDRILDTYFNTEGNQRRGTGGEA